MRLVSSALRVFPAPPTGEGEGPPPREARGQRAGTPWGPSPLRTAPRARREGVSLLAVAHSDLRPSPYGVPGSRRPDETLLGARGFSAEPGLLAP